MEIKRRTLLKSAGMAATLVATGGMSALAGKDKKKVALSVAHITDVHIRDGDDAPARFKSCLKEIITKHKPDFFLNGGDSIHDASYDSVVREQVTTQWGIWDDCVKVLEKYEVYSCIGNHDTWWKAPATTDEMYGKDYAVKRLKIPNRYYSFSKKNWHFVVLDGKQQDLP
jgi:Icc protein